MELVADTNIVAAAILRKGLTRELLFNPVLSLFSPDRLTAELYGHEAEFVEKSGLTGEQFRQAVALVLSRIDVLPFEFYSHLAFQARQTAPDKDDWPFLAVAMRKNCCLWSNDKKLRQQDKVKVVDTAELREILRREFALSF